MPDGMKLLPCPKLGGVHIALIQWLAFDSDVRIECTVCKLSGPAIVFASRRAQRGLLPDLATARRQAADDWNLRTV